MKVLTIGDSFTYGAELAIPNKTSWPAILAKDNDWLLLNLARGGASNDRSLRILFDQIDNNYDLIIVGWTYPERFEVNMNNNQGLKDIEPVDVSISVAGKREWTWALDYYSNHYDRLHNYQKYFREVIMLQSYLTQRNQKYLFCNVTGLLSDLGDHSYNQFTKKLKHLIDQINPAYYVGWPNEGMVEWAYGCPKGQGGHFLEEGHQRVAEKINEHIRHLGWVS